MRPAARDRVTAGRRAVLRAALGAGLGALPWWRVAGAAAAAPAQVALNERTTLLQGYGGNVLAVRTGAGLVLVDSGAAAHARALHDALPDRAPVRMLFNTHWHLDQIGGNALFGAAGAEIVAHEKTRLRLSTDYYLPAEDRYQSAQPPAAWPTRAFYTDGTLSAGGEQVEFGYLLEAHTDGDCYVYFRDANVLAVGDAASPTRDPEFDWFGGGWIGGRIDALALLLRIAGERTVVVPAWGDPVARDYLQAEHDLLIAIYDRMFDLVRKGYSAQDMYQAGVMDDLPRRFEDPGKFLYDAHKGLWAHHNALSHDVV